MSNRLYLASRKPGIGARVNSRHPLANGLIAAYLFAEGSGGTRNLVRATDPLTIDNGAWTVTQEGLAGVAGNWNGFSNTTPSLAVRPTFLKTVLWAGVTLGNASNLTDAPPLFAHYYDLTGTSPFNCGSIHRYTDNSSILFAWNNGAFGSQVASAILPGDNIPFQLALVLDGTSALMYRNGVLVTTSSTNIPTAGSPILYSGTSYQTFGVHPSTTVNANAAASMILEWDRPLSAAELAALRDEPYRMFFPYPSIILVTAPAGGGAITGSGGVSIQAPALAASGTYTPTAITGSGDVSVSHPVLAASGTYTPSGITGTATVLIGPLALAGTGVMTLAIVGSGGLLITVATITANGWMLVSTITATGALTIAHPLLDGSGVDTRGMGGLRIAAPTLDAFGVAQVITPTPPLMPSDSPPASALTPGPMRAGASLQLHPDSGAPAFERGPR